MEHMKAGWAFLLSGIFIIAIGVALIIVGWPPNEPIPSVINPAPTLSSITNETPVPSETTTISPTPTPTITISSDAIKLHFLDLAFGAGNAYLERWNATDNNGRIVISVTASNDADTLLLANAVRQFNSMSQTNTLSGQIKQDSTGDISIKFIPADGMEGIAMNASSSQATREFTIDGATAAKITRGSIYINANLKGDVRNHTLIRSLFYELGVVGNTDTYPDSVFYSGDNTNVNLTYADLKAIEIMYGAGLAHGMSVTDVKKVVYIR
jgi:hypothetical protein